MKEAFKGDVTTYTESEIDSILDEVKQNYANYQKREQIGPFYIKSTSTLKFLLEEQNVDISRFQKVREMYKEITLENTLKLLIRCKLAFDTRTKLICLFLTNEKYDAQLEKVQSLIKACKINTTSAADASQ